MADIIHYEVYVFQKNNWDLLARYPSEQRAVALEHAKNVEKNEHCQTKVLRETYNLSTQEFQESLIYLSEAPPPSPKTRPHGFYSNTGIPSLNFSSPPKKTSDGKLTKNIFVLILSILFSIIMAAILTAVLMHLAATYKFITPEASRLFSLICFFHLEMNVQVQSYVRLIYEGVYVHSHLYD